MLLWNSHAVSKIQEMLAILFLVPLPFLNPAWTLEFSVHVLLKPNLKHLEHYLASIWNECICEGSLNILWHCLSLGLGWKLKGFSSFQCSVATAEFSIFPGILSTALSQHHLLGPEIDQLESTISTRIVLSNASKGPLHFTLQDFWL